MHRLLILLIVLTSCAQSGAARSPPAIAPDVTAPSSSPVGFYSELAMREVIAGCERVISSERGKAKACEARSIGLAQRLAEVTELAKVLNRWQWLGPVLVGGLCLVVGGAIGVGVGYGLPRLVAQ